MTARTEGKSIAQHEFLLIVSCGVENLYCIIVAY